MSDEHKCSICGRDFDSERGLNVHKSQAHDDEEEQKMTDNDNNSNEVQTINLTLQHAMIGIFVLGLSVGVAGGMLFSGITTQQVQGTITTPSDTGQTGNQNTDNSDSGSSVSGSTPKEVFMNIGEQVGVDTDQLNSCFDESNNEETNSDVSYIDQRIQEVATERGLNRNVGPGTPTFFVGNNEIGYEMVEGAQPISQMRPMIQEQLNEAQNPGSDTIEEGTPWGGNSGELTIDESQLEGQPTRGDENAPINFVEFSDYGCPYCAEWFGVDAIGQIDVDSENSYETLISEYVDTGDVKFTYMDLPRAQLHPNAPDAHKAANCVLEQSEDQYWEFHDLLYEERDQWMSG